MNKGVRTQKKHSETRAIIKKFLLNVKALPKCGIYYLGALFGKSKPVKSKLVFVMSFPRSGTHALGSLVSQENIGFRYHGEFFVFNHWSSVIERLNRYYPFFSFRYALHLRAQRKKWKYYRFETTSLNPIRTIRALMKIHGIHIIKVFPHHLSDPVLESIIAEFKPHLIFLRRNHLDRFVSHKKANKYGKWHTAATEGIEIEIDEDELNTFISDYTAFYRRYLEFGSKQGCEILDIGFDGLHDAQTVRKIHEFAAFKDFADFGKLEQIPTTTKQDKSNSVQEKYLAKSGKTISDFDFTKIELN